MRSGAGEYSVRAKIEAAVSQPALRPIISTIVTDGIL